MNQNAPCPTCGKPLPADAPMGVCPNCLISAGFGTVTDNERAEKLRAFEPPKPEEIAAHFPHLEILELLGRGGMGAVYKARQTELDRMVALKILPPTIGEEAGFAERFAREAKALAKLNHPGIVTIHDFGRADGLFYFVMEFVDGVNLRQLLQGERIAPREALAIVPQICDALQFAHDHGIVHRDIKPENILMDRRGRVKVADFGIAKLTGVNDHPGSEAVAANVAFTEAGKIIGTPSYMAPEQVSSPGEVDHRADIYALGVVFYQMLTGELPGKQIEAPSHKVRVDVRLDEIVLRALERTPEMRYQQASVLKTHVEEVASDAKATPPVEATVTRVAPGFWAGRHRGMPGILWLTLSMLSLSVLSKFILLLKAGPIGLVDILFQVLLLFGLWFRFRLAYVATIVAALFMAPAFARIEWPFALLGLAVTAAIVGPVLWSTSWFLPTDMPRWKRRAWLGSTATLAAIAIVVGFAVPPSAILSDSGFRSAAQRKPAATILQSSSTRQITAPPFIAQYAQGTIELVALAPHPSTNGRAWLPNGIPTNEPFPSDAGISKAAGKVVTEMAFRIRSPKGHPGSPVVSLNAESGVTGMGLSQYGHHAKEAARFCVQDLACPPDAKEVNVQIGVADGVWETVVPIPAGGDKLYGSQEQSGQDGRWSAGFQGIAGENGAVTISFHFIRREEWETRLVAVMDDATVKPLTSARLDGDGGFWRGITSFSEEEFAKVAEISLQRRKYQWVEFRNVSLVRGHRTAVEIRSATSVSQATTPNATGARVPPSVATAFRESMKALLKRTFNPPVPLIDEQNLWGLEMAGDSPIEFTGKVVRVLDYSDRLAEDPRNTPHEVQLKLVSGSIPLFPDARRFTFVPRYEPGIPSLERFKPSQEVTFVCDRKGGIRGIKNVPTFEELKKQNPGKGKGAAAQTEAAALDPVIEVKLESLERHSAQRFLDLDQGGVVEPPRDYADWPREKKHNWMKQKGVDLMVMGNGLQPWLLLTPVDNEMKVTKAPARLWSQGLGSGLGETAAEKGETIQFVSLGVELVTHTLHDRPTHPDNTFLFQTADGASGILRFSELLLAGGGDQIGLALQLRRLPPITQTARTDSPPEALDPVTERKRMGSPANMRRTSGDAAVTVKQYGSDHLSYRGDGGKFSNACRTALQTLSHKIDLGNGSTRYPHYGEGVTRQGSGDQSVAERSYKRTRDESGADYKVTTVLVEGQDPLVMLEHSSSDSYRLINALLAEFHRAGFKVESAGK